LIPYFASLMRAARYCDRTHRRTLIIRLPVETGSLLRGGRECERSRDGGGRDADGESHEGPFEERRVSTRGLWPVQGRAGLWSE